MSILSGYKSFVKYKPSDDGKNWEEVSIQTRAKDVKFDDDQSLVQKMGGLSLLPISENSFNHIPSNSRNSSTLYIVIEE